MPAVYLPSCISWEINFIVPFPGVGSGQVPKGIVYIYVHALVTCMFENYMVGCIGIKFSVNSLFISTYILTHIFKQWSAKPDKFINNYNKNCF